MTHHPESDQSAKTLPDIPATPAPAQRLEMPAVADPQIIAEYRRVCADAIREFGGRASGNGLQREILHRMARLNARFTSSDVPKVGK